MSDVEFCGHLCMAARRLGISGKFDGDRFVWIDPAVQVYIKTPASKLGKQEILTLACRNLQQYLYDGPK